MTEPQKILYSVAYMRAVKVNHRGVPIWNIDISYLHAVDQMEARFMFSAGNTEELVNDRVYRSYRGKVVKLPMRRVIEVAPAVYVFEDQDTGERNADLTV